MRISRKPLHWLAATVVAVPAVIAISMATAEAETPDRLPLTITNDSGRAEATHVYILGTNLTTGELGFVDKSGAFTAWTKPSSPEPVPAPDVSIDGPANGSVGEFLVPKQTSGRVYVSFGEKLKFGLTNGGLVQPAPWVAADPNSQILFDWSEFTYGDAGLFFNTSMVDHFSVPHSVQSTSADGTKRTAGELKAGGREKIFSDIAAAPGDWAKLIQKRADGTTLRVIAPGKGVDAGVFDAKYLDPYIDEVWAAYADKPLTVVPFEDRPDTKFTGQVTGDDLNFKDGAGAVVATIKKPAGKDVWGCDGNLAAPNDQVTGPIARTLCAALHRSTLGTLDTQPTTNAGAFYTRELTDHYSKAMHANSVDGKAYGFAFDDVGHFESIVVEHDPAAMGITLSPF